MPGTPHFHAQVSGTFQANGMAAETEMKSSTTDSSLHQSESKAMRGPAALNSDVCADETRTHRKASVAMSNDAQGSDTSKPSQRSIATRFGINATSCSILPETSGMMSYSDALKSGPYVAPSYPTPPPPCKLFILPPELRNEIYEFLFTADTSLDEEIDLLAARAPSGDLLLTSSKIHAEAKGLFATARDEYWSTTNFVIHHKLGQPQTSPKGKTTKAALAAVPDAALLKITKLQLRLPLTGLLRAMYGRAPQITAMGVIEWIAQDHWQVRSESTTQCNFYIRIRHCPAVGARPRFFLRPPPNVKAIREAGTGGGSPRDVPVPLARQLDVIFRLLHGRAGGRV